MSGESEPRKHGHELKGKSLQQLYAPGSVCFGCGPANEHGLKLNSFVDGDQIVAHWTPMSHHLAFPGVLNGGIISTLLDCHCNWTAAHGLMNRDPIQDLPSTVTAELIVRMLKPTALETTLELIGKIKRLGNRSADVVGSILVEGELTASCEATFVAVSEGHPAFHRWSR